MRTIGAAERALESMCKRLMTREAFGKRISEHSVWEQRVAEARTNIEMCRLLTLKAADMMDKVGNKVARTEIAMIKVAAPRMALQVIDDAIQLGAGADRRWPARSTPANARCAWPTVRTKCTTARSPALNSANTRTKCAWMRLSKAPRPRGPA
jgi:alkylation response protein AidB-like acyl-CoA dehydrogenase